jgi:HK97 family phage prohead protease
MEEKLKKVFNVDQKGIDPEQKTVSGYVSTYGWDRDEERFVKGAWELANFAKNPVVLWSHDISSLPIGKNISMTEDEFGLKAVTQFDEKNPFAMQVFDLFQRGFLNSFSVGFIRKDYVMEDLPNANGRKGLAITKAELYEYSPVSVPANPGALASREVAELAMKTIGKGVIERIDSKSMGEQFLIISPEQKPDKPEEKRNADTRPADDFEPALRRIQELAKVAKAQPLDETKRSLVTMTMTVLGEMLTTGKQDALDDGKIAKLSECVKEFSLLLAQVNPASAENLVKTFSQVEKALKGRAA